MPQNNEPESFKDNKGQIESDLIRDILDKMDSSSLVVTKYGDIIFANKVFLNLHGITLPEVVNLKIFDPSLGITTEERYTQKLETICKTGKEFAFEHKILLNKELHYASTSIIPYKIFGQERYLFISKDVTELRTSQLRLNGLNQMLNKIIDNLPVYLFVKDVNDDLRYLIWNKAFAEFSKIPAEKVIGRTDFEVFPEYQDAQSFRNDDLAVIKNGEMTMKHETYVAADGKTRVVQTYKTLVTREDQGPLLIGISLDITDIESIEKDLVDARLHAEESDRLKSRFLANMSHEIRTPLNAIVGFAELLPEAEDEETRQQFLQIINENSELLLHLIDDILDISKIESGVLEYNRKPMDLLETCRNLLLVYSNKVPAAVKLIFDNDDTPGKLIINEDRIRLNQVLDNLISNAIKFTTNGEVHFGFTLKEDSIELYVKDSGKGIPKDKHEKIFDRFEKLDKFTQGTGLGLSICKMIVEMMGGKISLSSEEGRGSTFSFTIPYTFNSESSNHEIQPSAIRQSKKKGRHTILIAEDVPSNFLVVKSMIKDRHDIIWAIDGFEAVEMTKKENPDLILMDIKMPNMNGLDATREIRKFNADVPIIALTANAYNNDRAMAQNAGMNDYMSKPVSRDSFESILRTYLNLDE